MEWGSEQLPYIVPLEGYIACILPGAPQNLKKMARKINDCDIQSYGHKGYIGLEFRPNNMFLLRKPLRVAKESEHTISVEMTSEKGIVQYRFPKFGVLCQNGQMTAIEQTIRDEYLLYRQSERSHIKQYDISALDVSGPYEE